MKLWAVCSGDYNQFTDDLTIIKLFKKKSDAEQERKNLIEEWKYGKSPYRKITNPDYFEVQAIEVE